MQLVAMQHAHGDRQYLVIPAPEPAKVNLRDLENRISSLFYVKSCRITAAEELAFIVFTVTPQPRVDVAHLDTQIYDRMRVILRDDNLHLVIGSPTPHAA